MRKKWRENSCAGMLTLCHSFPTHPTTWLTCLPEFVGICGVLSAGVGTCLGEESVRGYWNRLFWEEERCWLGKRGEDRVSEKKGLPMALSSKRKLISLLGL